MIERWRQQARTMKRETLALFYAYQDPRTPWYARVVAALVVAYAFSPIDLIPDFIPVLGLLDDLLLVPLGIALAVRLIPPEALAAGRAKAAANAEKPVSYAAAAAIIALWLALAALGGYLLLRSRS